MWMAFLIVGAFFAAIVAIGWFGIQEGEDRLEKGAASGASPAFDGVPAVRAATSDQAVFEIEHRIHADLREVSHALRGPPERFQGVLRA